MNKPKYYPAKYFFLVIIIISLTFLIVNFWQLGKTELSYQPILNLSHKRGRVLGEEEEKFEAGNYILKIDKLRINTPIVFDISGEKESVYFRALEKGVAHLKNTSKPGETGNVVIFGHSSADIGATGDYNDVFAKLENLEENDEIRLYNKTTRDELVYTIYGREVIEPDDVSIIEQTDKNQLTLFTCWPVGSDEKRLVIYAKPE